MPNLVTVLKIKDFTRENAVSVPTNIIQQASDGSKFVYTVSSSEGKGVVKKVAIKIGTSYNGYTLIEEGLTGGENLVMKGYSEVVDGEEVQLVKE
jgi:multidrug efflux pump subunit AcrA (membrane-fusion protein)